MTVLYVCVAAPYLYQEHKTKPKILYTHDITGIIILLPAAGCRLTLMYIRITGKNDFLKYQKKEKRTLRINLLLYPKITHSFPLQYSLDGRWSSGLFSATENSCGLWAAQLFNAQLPTRSHAVCCVVREYRSYTTAHSTSGDTFSAPNRSSLNIHQPIIRALWSSELIILELKPSVDYGSGTVELMENVRKSVKFGFIFYFFSLLEHVLCVINTNVVMYFHYSINTLGIN